MRGHTAMKLAVWIVDWLIPWVYDNVKEPDLKAEITKRLNSLKHYIYAAVHETRGSHTKAPSTKIQRDAVQRYIGELQKMLSEGE